jgi:hypothetical protein
MGMGMGFSMKNTIRLYLVIIISFATLSSCLKKQNLDEQDLGPIISSDELQSKMGDSIGSLSYDDIRKNEINSIIASTTFEETQKSNRYKQDLYVTQLTDTADSLKIDFLFNRQDYVSSNDSLANQSYQLLVEKTRTASHISALNIRHDLTLQTARDVSAQADAAPAPFFLYRAYVYFAIQACREANVTCHNLKIESSKMYLNAELASPKVCPDTSNCLIDIKKIEFDMLDGTAPTANGKPYRMHYTFSVSPQLPFLSKVMRYCVRGLTEMNGRKVLAEDCTALNSFSYGQEP